MIRCTPRTARTATLFPYTARIRSLYVGGFGVWWFLKEDAPEEVSLESAVESVETTVPDESAPDDTESTDTTAAVADGDVSGAWTVDTETGEFDFESATDRKSKRLNSRH